ncbi:hypothetical protein JDV09_25155 [Mycobacterium sp. Y57]|uniref:hypothetical protein n=1 Tax=Mycolicibacterium xanthum TaxID=2796469 RepID=UPI001C84F4DC|nr:hypothetical protein [Mycolicibacterium xanthum]MBX7435364.1 hypothetical protein [Mycolicibacterium xanthum]
MAFTVYFRSGEPQSFDDAYTWAVVDGGALQVDKNTGGVTVYSPQYWMSIQGSRPSPPAG